MRTWIIIGILFTCLQGFAQKQPSKASASPNSSFRLNTASDSIQYSLGSFIAQWITGNGYQISNAALFIKAMDDVFQNNTRQIPDSIVSGILDAYRKENQQKIAAKQETQLFASLKDKPGVGMFPNGVRYVIIKTGKGPRPDEKDSVRINLIARLPDGTVVEDTYQSGKAFLATPTSFFPGLNAALLEMGEGAKWTLYVPSVLAYGSKGTALIPPNTALILEVELMEVKSLRK